MAVIKSKAESPVRWIILLLLNILLFGNYYCYDIPAALFSQLDDYMGQPGDFGTLFSLLYTVYAVPNVILPLFGGYFTDTIGSNTCNIAFCLFITIGQIIFAFGLSIKSWPVMFIGRFVFGLGGENLNVVVCAILSVWFKGKELAFAFGLNLSVARIGSVVNNVLSPSLTNSIGIVFSLWFGVFLCVLSTICAFLTAYFDHKLDKEFLTVGNTAYTKLIDDSDDLDDDVLGGVDNTSTWKDSDNVIVKNSLEKSSLSEENMDKAWEDGRRNSDEDSDSDSKNKILPIVQFRDVFSLSWAFWIICLICFVVYICVLPFNNIASSLLLERDYFKEIPDGCELLNPNYCQSDTNVPVNCPSSKWYQPPLPTNITLDGTRYEPLTSSDIDCTDDFWSDGCAKEFCNRESDAQLEAGTIMSIPYIISACLSPFLGGFVDQFAYRAVIAALAPAVLIIVHFYLGYTDVSPVGPLVGQGLAYSGFAAVIWPAMTIGVESHLVGLAFGVGFSVMNIGLAIGPLIIAEIYLENDDKYIPKVELFFAIIAICGFIIGIILNIYDYFFCDSVLNCLTEASRLETNNDEKNRKKSNEPDASLINPIIAKEIF